MKREPGLLPGFEAGGLALLLVLERFLLLGVARGHEGSSRWEPRRAQESFDSAGALLLRGYPSRASAAEPADVARDNQRCNVDGSSQALRRARASSGHAIPRA